MTQISIDEAVARSGVPRQTLEEWAERALLTLHVEPRSSNLPSGSGDVAVRDKWVDEDELDRVVESLGWLRLPAQGWDGTEEE